MLSNSSSTVFCIYSVHPFFKPYSTQVVAPAQPSVPPSTDKGLTLTGQEQRDQENTAARTRNNLAIHPPECDTNLISKENDNDNRRPTPPPSRVFRLAANPKM